MQKVGKSFKEDSFYMDKELEGMKKVRLVEEQIGYEELALMDNFSSDEITCELQRQILKEKKERIAL